MTIMFTIRITMIIIIATTIVIIIMIIISAAPPQERGRGWARPAEHRGRRGLVYPIVYPRPWSTLAYPGLP